MFYHPSSLHHTPLPQHLFLLKKSVSFTGAQHESDSEIPFQLQKQINLKEW